MDNLQKNSPLNLNVLKLLALLLPYYFMFYGPLHGNRKDPHARVLWRWVFTGFALYVVLALVILV